MSADGCCRYCTDRYLGCHSTCEKYKSFRKDLDDTKDKIKEAKKALYGECEIYKRDSIIKEKKKQKYRR